MEGRFLVESSMDGGVSIPEPRRSTPAKPRVRTPATLTFEPRTEIGRSAGGEIALALATSSEQTMRATLGDTSRRRRAAAGLGRERWGGGSDMSLSRLSKSFQRLAKRVPTGSVLVLEVDNLYLALRNAKVSCSQRDVEEWIRQKGMSSVDQKSQHQALTWSDFMTAVKELRHVVRPASGYEILRHKEWSAQSVDFEEATLNDFNKVALPEFLEPKVVIDEVKHAAREDREDFLKMNFHDRLHSTQLQSQFIYEAIGHHPPRGFKAPHERVLEARSQRNDVRSRLERTSRASSNFSRAAAAMQSSTISDLARKARSSKANRLKAERVRAEEKERLKLLRAWKDASAAMKHSSALEQRQILAEREALQRTLAAARERHDFLRKGEGEQLQGASKLLEIIRSDPRVAPLGLRLNQSSSASST